VNLNLFVSVYNQRDETIDTTIELPDFPEPGQTVEDTSTSGAYTVESTPGTFYLRLMPSSDDREYEVTVDHCAGPATSEDQGAEERTNQGAQQKTDQGAQQKTNQGAQQKTSQGAQQKTEQGQQPGQQRGTLLQAGGSAVGPLPLMPNGDCPTEWPVKRDGACYADGQ
jgi:hypothetical protein